MSDKFKDYGVSTIIAIDDSFREIKDDDLLSDFDKETIDRLTNYFYDTFSEYTVKEYSEEIDSDFKYKLSRKINTQDKYSCFKSTGIPFKAIVADFELIKGTIEDIDGTDKSRKHLILLDRTLQEDAGGAIIDNLFIDVLKFIHSKLREKNLLLLIYTDSTTPDKLKSFEGAKEYLRSLGLDESVAEQLVLHFNYVQKTKELTEDFFDNILKSQKANYISEYKNIFEESYSKLTERLWQLNQNQVLFYYDYINEGQHVDNIIYETFLTKFKQVYSDTFNADNNHKELINPMRRSMQKSVQSVQEKSKILRFLKEFDLGLTFNDRLRKIPASTDISFGDVIKIGTKKYLIVSQDCDMTIRVDNNRKLSNFQLVEIEDMSEEVTEKLLSAKLKKLGSDVNIDDPIVKEALERYGLSQDSIDRVVNRQTSKSSLESNQIGNLILHNDFKVKADFKIHLLECIWLDALLLKASDHGIILSEENILNSHEIRYATRNYLNDKFKTLIDIIGENSSQEVVDRIFKYIFNDIAIECEPIFSDTQETEESKLTGFILKNIERIGRLDRLDAMKIFKSIVEHEGRIPDIHTLLI
ncbi:TPA: hypothetical protein ACPYBJ_001508 [Streptococcus pneumoniae]|uniref:Uncharacterized protein n=6 Tax=Streptococcus pneumoniae TaxID=1313 RepID=A0A4J1TAP0_STREE|nr:hypothetical protein [Streptococcus pneumoniae]MDS2415312.1 hypothetical protein [Streptococcus pneumoniae]MDS2459769.1 hypothetical protein [Streptococcus pneumoniae]MDS2662568.1 hypothetical protein [Streptococcus pneumoniae]MDS2894715.1 hypothetical protein [Streptococcus pneumoniae]MDS2914364.1 hypothetical protein [Streptococcus pneumoniae]